MRPLNTNRPDRTAPVERTNNTRPKRIPLGQRNRLTFQNLDPEYTYRVINDQDDRLQRAQEAGYEFVTSQSSLGEHDVLDPTKMGSHVSKPVGGGTTGYLMRIKKDWYEEDQKAKLDKVAEIEAATKPKKDKGEYGEGLRNE